MRQIGIVFILSFLLCAPVCAITPYGARKDFLSKNDESPKGILLKADKLYQSKNYSKALQLYTSLLDKKDLERASLYRNIALTYAAMENSSEAAGYIEKYIQKEFDKDFLVHEGFKEIRETPEFMRVSEKYASRIDIWSLIYLYIAFIGFYIATVINLNKKIDNIAKVLISGFIFIHSFFILHWVFYSTNYVFEFPHSYLMSTPFSLLYGPLLYFYFKRITRQYRFKRKDSVHLLPTVLLLIYLIPVYSLSEDDKLGILLERAAIEETYSNYVFLIISSLKLISLIGYGFFIRKLYFESIRSKEIDKENGLWQKNIYRIHFLYVITYAIYFISINNNIDSGIIFNTQLISMALMVLYIGYSANVQPNVFNGIYSMKTQLFFKYKNSGLTQSLSEELKESLVRLFDENKIYKENDISLELVAKRLNTTRHNASQVINEHFKMNFHELINAYRIDEAKQILDNDRLKNLNIIDIAYEVGYNNKVTFNKAFKKDTHLTPTEYQKKTFGNLSMVNRA